MVTFLLGISVTINIAVAIFIYLYLTFDKKNNKKTYNSFFEESFKGSDYFGKFR